jgi:hypothetical protein
MDGTGCRNDYVAMTLSVLQKDPTYRNAQVGILGPEADIVRMPGSETGHAFQR